MKKTIKTLVVLGASIVLLGSQVCFAGNSYQYKNQSATKKTTQSAYKGTYQPKAKQAVQTSNQGTSGNANKSGN
jgi:hypothetical protein